MGTTAHTPLMASQRKFRRHGQSGISVSDWYPQIAECVDDLTMIHSVRADGLTHVASVGQMNTGNILAGRPSVGGVDAVWTGERNATTCPASSCCSDYPRDPPGGSRNWGTGFMPATFQGTKFRAGDMPILNVAPPACVNPREQRVELDYIEQLDRRHFVRSPRRRGIWKLASPPTNWPTGCNRPRRKSSICPAETAETRELYGLDHAGTADNGRNCLIARRLVERGVRFVQIYMGSGSRWDAH